MTTDNYISYKFKFETFKDNHKFFLCRNNDIPKVFMKYIKDWTENNGYSFSIDGKGVFDWSKGGLVGADVFAHMTYNYPIKEYSYELNDRVDVLLKDHGYSGFICELKIYTRTPEIAVHMKLDLLDHFQE